MTRIRLYDHPFAPVEPKCFQAESLAHWLVEHYRDRPLVTIQAFRGEPSAETAVKMDAQSVLAEREEEYVVLESPGEPISIGAILTNMAVSMAISLALNFLFAKDPKPLENRAQESPNNQLGNRENKLRLMERVEDIYGTVRAFPSLMMPTYVKYIDHRRVEYGYYCIGRGYYDVTDIRDGDTELEDITGASAAVYEPFTSPNSGTPQLEIGDPIIDDVLTVRRSTAVEGIVLKAANQLQLTAGQYYEFWGPGNAKAGAFASNSRDIIYQPSAEVGSLYNARRPNFSAVCEVGQTLTIDHEDATTTRRQLNIGTFVASAAGNTFTTNQTGFFRGVVDGSNVVSAGWTDPDNNGTFTVVSHTDETITVSGGTLADETMTTFMDVTFTVDVNYSATRTIHEVWPGYVVLSGAAQFSPFDAPAGGVVSAFGGGVQADLEVDNGLVDWTDWVTLPQTDREEVWANVVARLGMNKDDGAKSTATVEYEVQIEQLDADLDPLGVVETATGSITGATSTERAETLEQVTAWTGPCRVRARRTTPFDYDFTGAVNDEITWMDLYAVSPVDKNHFGNKTTIHTVTRSTPSSTAVRRRELNCLASRKLPTYNGSSFSGAFNSSGRHVSGTISATSRIVDIIPAVTIDPKIGARAISEVDMAQLWATQQALDAWHSEVGQFNHTLDTDTLGHEETVAAIANAAFCVPYRQSGKIRLALDRPQSAPVTVFTHRNKKPNAETLTRVFASESEYDGVELIYQDPDSEKPETIRLPLDGSATKYKRVEISGIRSFAQAWFRANREYYRLRYQRLSIETDCTTDARALTPNARVDIVDNTRIKSQDGEVIGQSGLTLTLSREVEFTPSASHSIVLMKRAGSIQSITCTAGSEANEVVLASAPAEAIVTTPNAEDGIRTIFSFASDDARERQAYLVQEIGSTDGQYVRVRAINYADEYYTADSEAVPDKTSVIND